MLANRNPDLYHGHNKSKNFFEGWYFKLVDAKKENVMVFIPGISYGRQPDHHHSFIQVIQAVNRQYDYLTYPVQSFQAERNMFRVGIQGNVFSLQGIHLDLNREEIRIQGDLQFSNTVKWPDSFIQPGSMGFYNYIPGMQCYAQVCAMDMDLSGSLTIDGREMDFTGGKGYVEKNWGKMFPYSWIWIQSNHFNVPRASLSCSLAHIPLPVGSFRGFLIGLLLDRQFFSFTTMNRSRMFIYPKGHDVTIRVENKEYVMKMDTETKDDNFILLKGPRDGQMVPLVQENLAGRVGVTLVQKRTGDVLFQSIGECAGIEYGGNQMMVLDQTRKD